MHSETRSDNDCLYIALAAKDLAKGSVAKSLRVTDDLTLDFDKEGRLIGLDIMNASQMLGATDTERSAQIVRPPHML